MCEFQIHAFDEFPANQHNIRVECKVSTYAFFFRKCMYINRSDEEVKKVVYSKIPRVPPSKDAQKRRPKTSSKIGYHTISPKPAKGKKVYQ